MPPPQAGILRHRPCWDEEALVGIVRKRRCFSCRGPSCQLLSLHHERLDLVGAARQQARPPPQRRPPTFVLDRPTVQQRQLATARLPEWERDYGEAASSRSHRAVLPLGLDPRDKRQDAIKRHGKDTRDKIPWEAPTMEKPLGTYLFRAPYIHCRHRILVRRRPVVCDTTDRPKGVSHVLHATVIRQAQRVRHRTHAPREQVLVVSLPRTRDRP